MGLSSSIEFEVLYTVNVCKGRFANSMHVESLMFFTVCSSMYC